MTSNPYLLEIEGSIYCFQAVQAQLAFNENTVSTNQNNLVSVTNAVLQFEAVTLKDTQVDPFLIECTQSDFVLSGLDVSNITAMSEETSSVIYTSN